MKLSIFPKAKALPNSGKEKAKEAKFTSKPYLPEIREFHTEDDLIDLITNYAWSPFIFEGFRREDNFISTDLLAFDVDMDMRIEEAEVIIKDLNITCLVLPTTSHTNEHHKFRILFPLSKTVTNLQEFKDTYSKYSEYFPVDPQCHDGGRMYFGSTLDDGFFHEANLLIPISAEKAKNATRSVQDHRDIVPVGENIEEIVEQLYGEKREKIPESVSYFLENVHTGLAGEMYNRGNSFLFTLGLQNVPYDNIINIFYQLYPHKVDNKVKKMVDSMINDGYNSRELEPEKEVKKHQSFVNRRK